MTNNNNFALKRNNNLYERDRQDFIELKRRLLFQSNSFGGNITVQKHDLERLFYLFEKEISRYAEESESIMLYCEEVTLREDRKKALYANKNVVWKKENLNKN